MCEHEPVNAAARCRLRGLRDGRVIVADVLEPLQRDLTDQVVPDHRVHEDVGARAQPIEPVARQRVTGEHDGVTLVLDSVGQARRCRPMLGRRDGDARARDLDRLISPELGHSRLRTDREVLMVREPELDVGHERREHTVDDFLRSGGPVESERRRLERRDPARRDDVAEVGPVVAVEVRQQHGVELCRAGTACGCPQQDTTAAVDEQVHALGAHQRRRPGAIRIGDRAARSEEDNFHVRDARSSSAWPNFDASTCPALRTP